MEHICIIQKTIKLKKYEILIVWVPQYVLILYNIKYYLLSKYISSLFNK